jgi:hypothetical protein
MRDERNPTPAEDDARFERALLGLLLDPDNQRPWAHEEIVRELGDPLSTVDALARLQAAGLIHRHCGFAWASRAALAAERLGR